MAGSIDLTLKDLVQISLGAPQLTKVNITILHSLIDLLLKKLNCEDEKVSIGGYEAICLQRILDESKISPLPLNDERIEMISLKLDRLTHLEERISRIDDKLDGHLDDSREFENINFDYGDLETYERVCEEICTVCDPENEVSCALIQNSAFLRNLARHVATPVVVRILDFKTKVDALRTEVRYFFERAEEEYKKISLIEECILRIDKLHSRMCEYEKRLDATMEELQDMLDAKVDKISIAPLKEYIQGRIDEVGRHLNKLAVERNCPRAAAVVTGDLKCMNCGLGNTLVGESADVVSVKSKPDAKYCACNNKWMPSSKNLKFQHGNQNRKKLTETPSTAQRPPVCKSERGKLNLIMGTDGQLYRKD